MHLHLGEKIESVIADLKGDAAERLIGRLLAATWERMIAAHALGEALNIPALPRHRPPATAEEKERAAARLREAEDEFAQAVIAVRRETERLATPTYNLTIAACKAIDRTATSDEADLIRSQTGAKR